MTEFVRAHARPVNALRPVRITRGYTVHAEGSVLIEFGATRVLCTASVEEKVPPHKRGSGEGWVTAEYGMLPRATHTRSDREAARGKQSGRTQEIQRLIGRSMRAVFDLKKLGERTIQLDCYVLQADGGTLTAAIPGAFVSAQDAGNGREAVDLFHQGEFDVILMDVQMPSMDGFQATDAIRKYEEDHQTASRIPIIAMTAHAMVGDRHRCLAAGMDDYISKPISIRRLIELVESHGQEGPRLRLQRNGKPISATGPAKSRLSPTEIADIMSLENSLRRLDGDKSLLIDLIGFYLEDYPSLLVRIDAAAAKNDAASLERAAHSMKGLVANFDAALAKEAAQQLETSAKQRDIAEVSGLIESLKQAADELAEHLERYRQSEASQANR